jgi:hypothetical protein
MKSQKVDRETNVTEEDLKLIFEKLDNLEDQFLKEAKLFLNTGSIYSTDLYLSAIINRAISFIRGFKLLATENNYISSVPIIRMQLDNCLRLYASSIVSSPSNFFVEYLKGTHISSLKDVNGNKMKDFYLINLLETLFPGIQNLYNNTSGYVHLSNEHSFLQTEIVNDSERKLETRIGFYDFYKIDEKVDFTYNMFKASEFLLKLVSSWRMEKSKSTNLTP